MVKNIQTAGYNGACMVYRMPFGLYCLFMGLLQTANFQTPKLLNCFFTPSLSRAESFANRYIVRGSEKEGV